MTPSRVMNSSAITFLMTEFLQHLATFGADHVCSSVLPFFSLPLAFGMTDGEQRFPCKLHVSLLLAEQEKNFPYLAQILGPTLAWERSADAPLPGLTKASHGC
jgi:hypothetical protein